MHSGAASEFSKLSIIKHLQAMEKKVIASVKQIHASYVDIDLLLNKINELYIDLHATFGHDILKQNLSKLDANQQAWIRDRVAYYNFQLKCFYQGLIVALKEDPEFNASDRQTLIDVFSQHSVQAKQLYDACSPPEPRVSISQPTQHLIFVTQPQPIYQENHYYYNWDITHSASTHDFWYWQGFSDGYADSNPNLLAVFFTNHYSQGYWVGEGVHAMVNLSAQAGRAIVALGSDAVHAAAAIPNAAVQVAQGIAEAGNSGIHFLATGAVHIGNTCSDLCNKCGSEICSCVHQCANVICSCGEAACSCAHNAASACGGCGNEVCACVHSVLSACGQCGDAVCSCARDCEKCGEDCCKCIAGVIGTVTTAIVGAYNKLTGSGSDDPVPPANNGTHTIDPTDANVKFTTLAASAEISGAYLTPIKWTWFSTYGAVMIPNLLVKTSKNISHIWHGYKRHEGITKLSAQALGLTGGYLLGELVPVVGGPHVAFVSSLFAGWASYKGSKHYLNSKNKQVYGQSNPDKYMLTSSAWMQLETAIFQEQKQPSSPLHIQTAIKKLETEIKAEKQIALANQGFFRKTLHRMWGKSSLSDSYPKTERQQHLSSALKALQQGELSLFKMEAQEAKLDEEMLILKPSAPPV